MLALSTAALACVVGLNLGAASAEEKKSDYWLVALHRGAAHFLDAASIETDASGELVAQISERFLEAYLAAAGDRVEDADRLRIRISVYKIISLLRRTMRSWQKFKGSRTASALAILEEEIACLPHLEY